MSAVLVLSGPCVRLLSTDNADGLLVLSTGRLVLSEGVVDVV